MILTCLAIFIACLAILCITDIVLIPSTMLARLGVPAVCCILYLVWSGFSTYAEFVMCMIFDLYRSDAWDKAPWRTIRSIMCSIGVGCVFVSVFYGWKMLLPLIGRPENRMLDDCFLFLLLFSGVLYFPTVVIVTLASSVLLLGAIIEDSVELFRRTFRCLVVWALQDGKSGTVTISIHEPVQEVPWYLSSNYGKTE